MTDQLMGCPPRNRLFYRPLLDDVHHVVITWERNLTHWRRREAALVVALIGAVVAGTSGIIWISARLEKPAYVPLFANTQPAAVAALESHGAILGRDHSGRITRAVVESPGFGDADLALLAAIPELQTILLVGCPVTDAGLVTLRTMPNLRSVHLIDTRVTDEGSGALQAALPQALVRVKRTTDQ